MADDGVKSNNFDPVEIVTELIGNASDGTGRIAVDKLAAQFVAAGPIGEALDDVETKITAAITTYNVTVSTASALPATGYTNGSTGRVLDTKRIYTLQGGAWVNTGPLPETDIGASAATTGEIIQATVGSKAAVPSAMGDILQSWGDRFDDMNSVGVPFGAGVNGGSSLLINGVTLGISIPAGSSGVSSYVVGAIPLTDDLSYLVGKTIIIRAVYDATANFITEKPPSTLAAQVVRGSGNANVGTVIRSEQIGTKLVREIEYTVTSDDLKVGVAYQLSGSGNSTANAHTLQLVGTSFRVKTRPTISAGSIADEAAAAGQRRAAKSLSPKFTMGDYLADATPAPQYANGAVARAAADGRNWGFTILAGSTGQNSLIQAKFPFDASKYAGRTIIVTMGCTTSANYALGISSALIVTLDGASSTTRTNTLISNKQVSSTRRVVKRSYVLQGDEVGIWPYVLNSNASAVGADAYLTVTDLTVEFASTISDILTPADETLAILMQRLKASALSTLPSLFASGQIWQVTLTVKADGTGNYTHPKLALDAIKDASLLKRYRILIYPGKYTGYKDWYTKDFVDLVGIDRKTCIIHYENADSVDPDVLKNTQTLWCNSSTMFMNLTITGKNLRYPMHSDASGAAIDKYHMMYNCHVEHLGNDGARTYQTNNGGNPALIFGNETPWGIGTSSGMVITGRQCTFIGTFVGWYHHTRDLFSKGCFIDVEGCKLVATKDSGSAIVVQPLGSRINCRARFVGCEIIGDITYNSDPWIPTTIANQPSDHAEVKMIMHGNTPAVFVPTNGEAKALMITSATTGVGSSVAISGTAAAVMFGSSPIVKAGAVGGNGYVYGDIDEGAHGVGLNKDVFITSLGHRLGDLSSTSKTLTVTIDGGTPINIVFNQNYTPADNTPATMQAKITAIIAAINAALGSAGTASELDVTKLYRPTITDEEAQLKNTSGSFIPMGTVLAYDATAGRPMKSVRPMTSTDAVSLFAGVAWEDIYPNEYGRVKNDGYLAMVDILRTDSATFAFGDTFSITAGQPGKISKGGSQGLFPAIRSDAVRLH